MDAEMRSAEQPAPLPFTGERLTLDGAALESVWEHVYRYRFAVQYVRGRDVLDVASGEGYGTAALAAAGARSVVGVEIDPATCEYSRQKYKEYGIDIRQGDAQNLPLPDNSVDVVVSFETIEHVPDPRRFLDECYRVLRPGGWLVISTPNVQVYNPDQDPGHNPYHCSEMTAAEFRSALAAKFRQIEEYTQRPVAAWWLHPRSLASYPTPWLGKTGYGRLRSLCRIFRPDAEREVRTDPVRVILEPDEPRLGRLVNWYRVRPRSRLAGEAATFLVCVAEVSK